jgi:MoaA/NifB/PqqE/SkfB family radical SAM enzyme
MNTSTFCSALWTHQTIDGAGRIKPCCRFLEEQRPKEHNLTFHSIEEIFNSDFQNQLREKALKGEKIEGCKRCYEEEDNQKKSLRNRLNDFYKIKDDISSIINHKIEYLEIGLSNHCNLMCRMCDSRYSHKLYDDEKEYNQLPFSPAKFINVSPDHIYPHLKDLKFIKFTGGEPLIIKEYHDILKKAIDLGYSKNISINFTTNCTIRPREDLLNLWREFKKVELIISFDSINKEENEYQRFQTDQEKVIKNIENFKFLKDQLNISFVARPTVSIFTVYHLPETLEWLHELDYPLNPIHLTHPTFLSITVLPEKQKSIIFNKYKNYKFKNETIKNFCDYILNYMSSEDNSHLIEKFKSHTQFLDLKRNQLFNNTFSYYDF